MKRGLGALGGLSPTSPGMIALAEELGLPSQDIVFMRDTFAIILLARHYYLLPSDAALPARIEEAAICCRS